MAPSSGLTAWARESRAPEGDIKWTFLAVGNKAAILYPYYPVDSMPTIMCNSEPKKEKLVHNLSILSWICFAIS